MRIAVLSVWQPWASLMALGIKTIETRCDPAPAELVGQRIAIHASQSDSKRHVYEWVRSRYPEAVAQLEAAGLDTAAMPRGVVLATARLVETRKTDWRDWPQTMSPVEDFWGWVLDDIRLLPEPIAAAGEAGLFEIEMEGEA